MGTEFLSFNDFVRIVQNVIDHDNVAQVEWMGEDGGQGTIRVYYNPHREGSTDQIVVDEQGDITYFNSLASVYQQGLDALGCFPIRVTIAGSEDDIDEPGSDEDNDTEEPGEDDLSLINLVQWNCSICVRNFYTESTEKKGPASCPFCQSNNILPMIESE